MATEIKKSDNIQEVRATAKTFTPGYRALTSFYPVMNQLVSSGTPVQELPKEVMGVKTKNMPRQTLKNKMFEELPSGMAPLVDPRLEQELKRKQREELTPTFSNRPKIKPTPYK